LLSKLEKLPRWCGHVYVIVGMLVGFALFSCSDMQNSAEYLRAMVFRAGAGVADGHDWYLVKSYAVLFVLAIAGSTSAVKRFASKKSLPRVAYLAVVFVLCVAMLVNSSYNPFLYFRF
ncbi:MAG: MBOAT family protein, partial [Lachnospiraceae bacterium]|nr:MBOAT family protein [Lachnospiraceae bacterium]